MRVVSFFLTITAAALMSACSLPLSTPPSPTPLPVLPASPSPVPALTETQILNAVYTLPAWDGSQSQYALQDGGYQSGSDPAATGYAAVFILRERIALGDLNGDGLGDAVVPIGLNFGGTGQFMHLTAVLNQGGKPVQAAPATYGIGDRTQVQSLQIEQERIFLEALISGPNDPACCGTTPQKMTLEYAPQGFRLLRLVSGAADGRLREINITAPASEAVVSPQTLLEGHTSIGPFENTLVYRVYDSEGSAVIETGFQVQNSAPGEPATFSLPLDFSQWNLRGRVRVEIAERSPADGSTLALDSVYLLLP